MLLTKTKTKTKTKTQFVDKVLLTKTKTKTKFFIDKVSESFSLIVPDVFIQNYYRMNVHL